MAASIRDDDDGTVSGINVTPLVDITLVLLIIFMVTAKLLDGRALPLQLPPAVAGNVVQTPFAVELYANGEAAIGGKKIASDEAVLGLAREARARDPELRAVIRADAAIPHGRVIHVLDLLKRAEVSRIAFGVAEVPDGAQEADKAR